VNDVEAADLAPVVDLSVGEAECGELPPRDDAVLSVGQLGDGAVRGTEAPLSATIVGQVRIRLASAQDHPRRRAG